MRGGSRPGTIGIVAVATGVVLGACSTEVTNSDGGSTAAAPGPMEPTEPLAHWTSEAERIHEPRPALDPRAEHAYWSSVFHLGGLEFEHFESLESLTRGATAVVLARLDGRFLNRAGPPVESGGQGFVGHRFQVLDVVAGTLPAHHRRELVVETMGSLDDVDGSDVFPVGDVLLFLHRKGDPIAGRPGVILPEEREFYRLVTTQGIFVQTEHGVRNPVYSAYGTRDAGAGGEPQRHGDVAVEDAEGSGTLAHLADRVRAIDRAESKDR